MKQILLIVIISFSFILLSCEKDSTYFPGSANNIPSSSEYSLAAYNWEKQADGSYINTFYGFLKASTTHTTMNVYVVSSGNNIQIDHGPITFFAGTLQSMCDGDDLQIIYRPYVGNANLPFTYLDIKVIFT